MEEFLSRHQVPHETRDVDLDPLTARELWQLLNRKQNRLRVPFTALNDGEDVVLGYDVQRLEGVFLHGELGGNLAASAVHEARCYDDFSGDALDDARWQVAAVGRHGSGARRLEDPNLEVRAGGGQLQLTLRPFSRFDDDVQSLSDAKQLFVSTERMAPPPGAALTLSTAMAVRTYRQRPGDPYDALGMTCAVDLLTGYVMGVAASNDGLYAVFERMDVPGVATPEEAFRHRVVLDVDHGAERFHDIEIAYRPDSREATWTVDGHVHYRASTAVPLEGLHAGMGLYSAHSLRHPLEHRAHGQGVRATWRAWSVSVRAG